MSNRWGQQGSCYVLGMLRGRTTLLLTLLTFGLALAVTACGPTIPEHNGYKSAKATPWRSPKAIKLDEKQEGKADGELDYASQKRAKWYAVDLPSSGDLQVTVEANPANDTGDFDLGIELVGPGNRVLAGTDPDDEDARELTKTRSAAGLLAGRYLIHLYLQGRLDNSDYEVKVRFSPKFTEAASDFPAQVQYLRPLALVPVIDDTPGSGSRGKTVVVRRTPGQPRPRPPKPEEEKPPSTTVTATVLRATMNDQSTILIVSAGASAGVADGWKGVVAGVKGSNFRVTNVTERNCRGIIGGLTAEQVSGKKVILTPP